MKWVHKTFTGEYKRINDLFSNESFAIVSMSFWFEFDLCVCVCDGDVICHVNKYKLKLAGDKKKVNPRVNANNFWYYWNKIKIVFLS